MEHIVEIKGVRIGEGTPKICVSLTGSTQAELNAEAKSLVDVDLDIAEWRVDFFEEVEQIESVLTQLAELREVLGEIPLIFTFRSAREGGQRELPQDLYIRLNSAVAASGHADLIDIELMVGDEAVRDLATEIHRLGAAIIISNHDFYGTPAREELVSRLKRAHELGADLPKIAVMPRHPGDVLALLAATYEVSSQLQAPIITMSMGKMGAVSRIAGEAFGSAVTFGAAKKASAPGQIAVSELRSMLNTLHD